MAKKKNKKNIAKRQARAGQRKAQKRKLRLVKAAKQQQLPNYDYPPPGFARQPPMVDVEEAPPGFRAVGINEALMEFAKAMIKHPDIKGLNSIEDAFRLAMPLWNYAIAQERSPHSAPEMKSEIIKALMPACKVNREQAEELADKVVARKNEMFPPGIQPQDARHMFMRKEVRHLITPFNYDRLTLSDKVIPVTEEDQQFLDLLTALDEAKLAADDYDDWQGQYEPMEEKCRDAFETWLEEKDVDPDFIAGFGFLVTSFVNFVYNYGHDEIGILRNADHLFFEDFFYDFVLRKIMMEPNEHVEWAPALRLFFLFLAEKGYLDDAAPYVEAIDGFEEPFLQLLRKEYG